MALVEIDTLQRVRDMQYDVTVAGQIVTTRFAPSRIEAINVGNSSYLIMSDETIGFGVALIEPTGGLAFIQAYGSQFEELEGIQFGTSGLASFEVDGKTHVYLNGGNSDLFDVVLNNAARGVSSIRFNSDGDPDYLRAVSVPGIPAGGGQLPAFGEESKIVTIGNTNMLILPSFTSGGIGDPGFETFKIRDNGTLVHLRTNLTRADRNEKFDVVQVDGQTFVVSLGYFDQFPLQVLKVGAKGAMRQVYEHPTTDNQIYNQNIIDVAGVTIGDRAFVYLANNTSGAILGYEVYSDGSLHVIENEFAGTGDDWRYPGVLEVFEDGGKHYLVAGSNALAVFEITAGGGLHEVDELPETFRSRLVSAQDVDTLQIGGQTYIFASTATQDEVRSYRFIPQDESMTFGNGGNVIKGTDGDDLIFARGGHDVVRAQDGDDVVEGGNGNDRLFGMNGNDSLYGGEGEDEVYGGDGFDFVFGDGGKDRLFGGHGNDIMYGGDAADRMLGEDGNDRMDGGGGRDVINGGTGFDRIIDGAGIDRLFGGANADVFELDLDGHRDFILDYEDNSDTIDLTRWGEGLEFSDLVITQSGNNVLVSHGNEEILIRSADGNIQTFELSLGDFVFFTA